MYDNKDVVVQLQRYYSLWRDSIVMYEEWAKEYGLSSNGIFVLYSFYESEGKCTQKMISEKWHIPKQTVNTILKDFQNKGYVEMVSSETDKRNKIVCLTKAGKKYADDIIGKLQKKEIYVIEKMGLDSIKSMNDNTELFINLFREGEFHAKES